MTSEDDRGFEPRPKPSKSITLQPRDIELFTAVHEHDGLLTGNQAHRLFWIDAEWQAVRKRLAALWTNGYLNKCKANIPSKVYCLTAKAAKIVAEHQGVTSGQLKWRREPRWSQLTHDITVNDFRLDVAESAQDTDFLRLHNWIGENAFSRWRDEVHVAFNNKSYKKIVEPDGYFEIAIPSPNGRFWVFRCMVEIEISRKGIPRIINEKILPGLAYIRSPKYKQRFGHNSGRWLFIVPTELKMRNLKQAVEEQLSKGSHVFWFAWSDDDNITPQTVLTEPIWYRGGSDEPQPLFTP